MYVHTYIIIRVSFQGGGRGKMAPLGFGLPPSSPPVDILRILFNMQIVYIHVHVYTCPPPPPIIDTISFCPRLGKKLKETLYIIM